MKLHEYPVDLAQAFWTATAAFVACFVVTVAVSIATTPTKNDEELKGLVYSLTPKERDANVPLFIRPAFLGTVVLIAVVVLNWIFR